MMKARTVLLFSIVIMAVLALALPASGEPEQDFVIVGADEVVVSPVSIDPGLPPLLDQVGPRVLAQYSNHVRHMDLPVIPSAFQTLLNQISERVIVEYANDIVREELLPAPAGLQSRLDEVTARVVFEYANADLRYSLAYPRELINDTTPPEVSEVGAGTLGANGVLTITWTTDEFADSAVFYGTQSGAYSHTVSDTLYVKVHAIGLAGLTAYETYYYKLRSIDLSGNITTTDEFTVVAKPKLFRYLPVVLRNRS
jgi:hypothetical protein